MYVISDSTKRTKVNTALTANSREFSNRISFGYYSTSTTPYTFVVQHTVCELSECSVEQSVCAGDKLTMSGACSASLNATFTAREATVNGENKTTSTANFITNYSYKNKIAFVECGIKYDTSNNTDLYYYIPIGYFVITDAESENDWKTVKITGYDYINSVMDDKNNLVHIGAGNPDLTAGTIYDPEDSDSIMNQIAAKFGLSFMQTDGEAWIDIVNETYKSEHSEYRKLTSAELTTLNGVTWREAFGRLCGIFGATGKINTQGKLAMTFFDLQSVMIPASMQYQDGFKKLTDSEFEINSITSNNNGEGADNTYTAGSGTGISFTNVMVTHDDIDNIQSSFAEYESVIDPINEYLPCEILWRGNPCIEAGDAVTVTYNSNSYTAFIAKQTVDLVGGLSMKVVCPPADEEVRFDTGDWVTETELANSITDVRQALAEATAAINGSEGGYIEINDTDGDGNPDEILITQVEGGATGNVIRLNQAGIGLSTSGNNPSAYTVAITGSGINASLINSGVINADLITAGSINADLITTGTIKGELVEAGSITVDKLNIGGAANNLIRNYYATQAGTEGVFLWNWNKTATKTQGSSTTAKTSLCVLGDMTATSSGTEHITINGDEYIATLESIDGVPHPAYTHNFTAQLLKDLPQVQPDTDYYLEYTVEFDDALVAQQSSEVFSYVTVQAIVVSAQPSGAQRQDIFYNSYPEHFYMVSNLDNTMSATLQGETFALEMHDLSDNGKTFKQRLRFPSLTGYTNYYMGFKISVRADYVAGTHQAGIIRNGIKNLRFGEFEKGDAVVAGSLKSFTEDTYFDLDEAQIVLNTPSYVLDAPYKKTAVFEAGQAEFKWDGFFLNGEYETDITGLGIKLKQYSVENVITCGTSGSVAPLAIVGDEGVMICGKTSVSGASSVYIPAEDGQSEETYAYLKIDSSGIKTPGSLYLNNRVGAIEARSDGLYYNNYRLAFADEIPVFPS